MVLWSNLTIDDGPGQLDQRMAHIRSIILTCKAIVIRGLCQIKRTRNYFFLVEINFYFQRRIMSTHISHVGTFFIKYL